MCFGFVRMIHGFTSTGLTQTQYVNYSKATNIGYVEDKYISTGKCTMCRMYIALGDAHLCTKENPL